MLCSKGLAQQTIQLNKAVLDSIATQDVPPKAPGIATAIIENGRVIYQQIAGYANLKDSLLIDTNTRFNIASNGKQFTALAICLLAYKGKLSLDDDVRKYLPQLLKKIPQKIRIRELLHHTSGIRDVYDLWSLQGITWWKQAYTLKDALALLEQQESLNFSPGSQYRYSNSNYILLAAVIEKVSKQSFTAFTQHLFKEMGMLHTKFEDQSAPIEGTVAKAYFNFDSWTTYDWKWRICGDGNCFTTLNDQIRWEQIVQGAVQTNIPRAVIQQLQSFPDQQQYGYGLERGTYKQLPYTFHEGATGAWKATVLRFTQKNIALITLTNTGKSIPAMQTRQMADVLFHLRPDTAYFATEPKPSTQQFTEASTIGIYTNASGFSFQFLQKGADLLLRRIGRNDVILKRKNGHVWQQQNDTAFQLAFNQSVSGTQTVTAYYTTHPPYSLTKIVADWTGFNYSAINGTFYNSETKVSIHIQHKEDKKYTVVIGQDTTTGLLITPNQFKVNGYLIHFNKDASAFSLNGERILAVQFRRKK